MSTEISSKVSLCGAALWLFGPGLAELVAGCCYAPSFYCALQQLLL